MSDYRYGICLYSVYDHSNIEKHLARMAEKGWLLCSIGFLFWKYRRIEPRKMSFAVTYDAKGSDYDYRVSDSQQGYLDLGASSGWKLAASSYVLRVFYNEEQDPVPMETDPAVQLECITRSMRKFYLRSCISMLVLSVLHLISFFDLYGIFPIDTLSEPTRINALELFFLADIYLLADLLVFLIWRIRAGRAARAGVMQSTPNTAWVGITGIVLILAVLAKILFSVYPGGRGIAAVVVICTIVFFVGGIGVRMLVKKLLENKGCSKGSNIAVNVVAVAVYVAVMMLILRHAAELPQVQSALAPKESGQVTAEISLRELTGKDPVYPVSGENRSSDLLEVHVVYQDYHYPEQSPNLGYRIGKIRLGLFESAVKKAALKQRSGAVLAKDNASLWNADEAYMYLGSSGEPTGSYIAFYGDRFIEVWASWALTPEQKALIGSKMGR